MISIMNTNKSTTMLAQNRSGKLQAMMGMRREAALVSPPMRVESTIVTIRNIDMPPPRTRTPIMRFSPDMDESEIKLQASQQRKLKALLQTNRKLPVSVQKPKKTAAAPKPTTILSNPVACSYQDSSNIDIITQLVLQNARNTEDLKACARIQGKRWKQQQRDKSAACNPFRRLALLAYLNIPPKFSDYLHVMAEYKATHGHICVPPNQEPRFQQWLLGMQRDLEQCETLTPAQWQRTHILKQLGLAEEILGVNSSCKRNRKRPLESKLDASWPNDFLQFVVEPMQPDYIESKTTKTRRLEWLQQQRTEYYTIKSKCADPFTNIQANYRYILLNDHGVNMRE
jgi:hypothetical protein